MYKDALTCKSQLSGQTLKLIILAYFFFFFLRTWPVQISQHLTYGHTMCVGVHMHAEVHVKKLKDNFGQLVLSSYLFSWGRICCFCAMCSGLAGPVSCLHPACRGHSWITLHHIWLVMWAQGIKLGIFLLAGKTFLLRESTSWLILVFLVWNRVRVAFNLL